MISAPRRSSLAGLVSSKIRLLAIFVVLSTLALICLLLRPSSRLWGQIQSFDGDQIAVLRNTDGAEAHILTYGAIIQSLLVPDKTGILRDVALGFDTLEPYQNGTSPYFGATIGRVANRIAKGRFSLDGTNYSVSINDGPNSLHGGEIGWSRKQWNVVERQDTSDGAQTLLLGFTSPDGDQGFPGTVNATVRFTLSNPATLEVEFGAVSDAPTPINMAQHTYFNLDGVDQSRTILNHIAQINASYVTPVDSTLIPTGQFTAVSGTPFDFSEALPIGQRIQQVPGPKPAGYDINYVLWGRDGSQALANTVDCKALQQPALAVTIASQSSGIGLQLYTTSPGLQFYTGNYLNGTTYGKRGIQYVQYGAFAVESQVFPDFMNQPNFPKCVLNPGHPYSSMVTFKFGTSSTPASIAG